MVALFCRCFGVSPVFPFLPVWPSSPLPWASPGKLCVGRCVGETGLCIGVCSSSRVARWEQEFRRMCSCGIWNWLASASRINDALR